MLWSQPYKYRTFRCGFMNLYPDDIRIYHLKTLINYCNLADIYTSCHRNTTIILSLVRMNNLL